MPLNEECGLIEWVNNTVSMRGILIKGYESRGVPLFNPPLHETMDKGRKAGREAAAKVFVKEILPR